jgi:uncharacterized Zn finger protein (UPF0148 family)|tara:strand:- start:925 stop:1101 length:177 start_codon:yes stop_codon:yes gene_type:complete
MICRACGEKVYRVINYRGTIICMDCYTKKKGPIEVAIEEDAEEKKMERIRWMHREKYI